MGGDHGPAVTVAAALRFLESNPGAGVILVGLRDAIDAELRRRGASTSQRVSVRHAAEVSAGNTGALMATAHFVLRTLPGIDRPALVSVLPTMNGQIYMLDLGASPDCKAEHLLQFAVMGSM